MKGLPWSEPPIFVAAVDPDHLRDKPENLDQKLVAHMLELRVRFGGEAHLYHYDWLPPLSGLILLELMRRANPQSLPNLEQ